MARPKQPLVSIPPPPPEAAGKLSRAEQAKLAALREDADLLLKKIGMPNGYSQEAVVQYAIAQASQLEAVSGTLGASLVILRAYESAAFVREFVERIGVSEGTARNAIAVAFAVLKSPGHKKIVATVGPTKSLAIFRALSDADIGDLAEDDAQLEAYAIENVKGVLADLKKQKATVEKLQGQLDKERQKVADLEDEREHRDGPNDDQAHASRLIGEFSAAVTTVFRASVEVERLLVELMDVRKTADIVSTEAINTALEDNMHMLKRKFDALLERA